MGVANGARWRALKAQARTRDRGARARCWRCREPIDYTADPQTPNAWEPDHYWPRSTHPHLVYELSNLMACHCSCNRSRGDAAPAPQRWAQAEQW